MYDLSYLYLRPMLHLLELADYSFQSLACYLLALAQVLGIAVCPALSGLVHRYDHRSFAFPYALRLGTHRIGAINHYAIDKTIYL